MILHTPAEAAAIAEANQHVDEDGWTYDVEARGERAVVRVLDEDGEFVGYL